MDKPSVSQKGGNPLPNVDVSTEDTVVEGDIEEAGEETPSKGGAKGARKEEKKKKKEVCVCTFVYLNTPHRCTCTCVYLHTPHTY